MGWEHEMAGLFKAGGPKNTPVSFTGNVLSPVRRVDSEGRVTYSGELIISAFDGEVMLRADRLQQLAGAAQAAGEERFHDGQTVALLGDVFYRTPGGQKILILGVVQDAV